MQYQSDPAELERLRQLARDTAAEVSRVTNSSASQAARDAAIDYQNEIATILAEDESLRKTLAEAAEKEWLLYPDARQELRRRIVADHRARVEEADRRAAEALDALKTQLKRDALPKVDPARESLGRQELTLAVGNASGEQLVGSLMALADRGNPDTLAVLLNSSFGETLLAARGVDAKRAAEAMADLRTVAANAAATRGDSDAAQLVGIESELVSARAAAMSAVAATADEATGVDAGAPR